MPAESIEKVRRTIPELAHGDFAENIVTAGVDMVDVSIGDSFRAGREVVLEVTQIGKKCHNSCAIREKTGDCIMPREGIFCRVVEGGRLKPGDRICRVP